MNKLIKVIWNLIRDIVGIVTSTERLKQKLRVSLFRNAIYLISATAVTSVFGLAFWLVTSRWLYGPEAVGIGSAVISAIGLLGLISTLGLDFALIRFLPNAGDRSNAMVNTCLTLAGLASILASLIFITGIGWWSPALLFLQRSPTYFIGFVVFTMCYTLYAVQTKTFVAMRRSGFSMAQNFMFNILRFPLVIILAVFSAVFGIVASWGFAIITGLFVGAYIFQPRVQNGYRPVPMIKREVVSGMIHYSFASYITELLWLAPTTILPIMVVNRVGAEANAYFFIAWAISSVLFAVPTGITFSLFAEGSHAEEKLGADTKRSLIFILVILIPAILVYFLLGHIVLSVFSSAYAENATNLLWVLAISSIPLSLNYIYTGTNRVRKRMKGSICLNAFITVSTVTLSWFLLPRMGIMGAGTAWLFSQSVAALMVIAMWLPNIRKGILLSGDA